MDLGIDIVSPSSVEEIDVLMLLPMSMSHVIPSLKRHIFPSINPPWMIFRWSPFLISNLYCW